MKSEMLSVLNSKPIINCQLCESERLQSLLFLGYIPPVNLMPEVGGTPDAELRFPLEMLRCEACNLVQIGYDVDQRILFPHSYPYLSGSTRILRDNFRELATEARQLFDLTDKDLVVDFGANDGTLLQPFHENGHKVLGIEPSKAADIAREKGIAMIKDYFNLEVAKQARKQYGAARIVTAANVFAHITDVHQIVRGVKELLAPNGVFVSESHYLLSLIETLQYDTIYHEHLRYYSLHSLKQLFAQHDLEIIHAKRIPTHGGSIRVYCTAKGNYPVNNSVNELLALEQSSGLTDGSIFKDFRHKVLLSKLNLQGLLSDIKAKGQRVYGIGAPSRASTLINYVGLDDGTIDAIMEISSSHKLNKYIPGTRIPVLDEAKLYSDQPEYALLFSWHIADELCENLRKKGYRGKFIVPLPQPKIVS